MQKQGNQLMIVNAEMLEQKFTLPLIQLKFTYEITEGGEVNDFLGSAIRGYLGRTLKKEVCTVKNVNCTDCFFKSRCTYAHIFEPLRSNFQVDSTLLSAQNQIPPPLMIKVDNKQKIATGNLFCFTLTVVGHLPESTQQLLLKCFKNIQFFMRHHTIKMQSKSVEQLSPLSWLNAERPLTITMNTPTSIKLKGKVLKAHNFSIEAFLLTLIRRIKTLALFYGQALPKTEEKKYQQAIQYIQLTKQTLQNAKWQRYSFKQKQVVPMQGVFGDFTITGQGLKTLLPLLQLGEQINNGKGSFMGLGSFSLSNEN